MKGQVWWLPPVIPRIWEAEAGRSWVQECKTSLDNMVKPHLYKKKKNTKISWAWWCMPMVPAIQEAEVRGSLEPMTQRLQRAKIAPLYSSQDDRVRPCFKKKDEVQFFPFSIGSNPRRHWGNLHKMWLLYQVKHAPRRGNIHKFYLIEYISLLWTHLPCYISFSVKNFKW